MKLATTIAVALTLALAALLASGAAFGGCADPVHAQVSADVARGNPNVRSRRHAPRMDPRFARAPQHVALARVAWVESGARVPEGEVAAIHDVILNRDPGGFSYHSVAWGYSVGVRNPRHTRVHNLLPSTRFGASTPRYYAENWPRVLDAARRAVLGELTHDCGEVRLMHWGGPNVDAHQISRLERSGYEQAECPDNYRNTFLYRP